MFSRLKNSLIDALGPPRFTAEESGLRDLPGLEPSRRGRTSSGPAPELTVGTASLIEDLFDEAHGLMYLETLKEGAEFILDIAIKYVPAHAGLVSFYDINRAEFVVVTTRGSRSGPVLGSRFSQGDPWLREAMRLEKAVQVPLGDAASEERSKRVRVLSPLRSVLVAPCNERGQDVGGIELYDSKVGELFTDAEESALEYLGRTLCSFVLSKGLVIDSDVMEAQVDLAPPPPV